MHLTFRRVALARALYGRFDSLVLDDVFSALDAETEAHVFTSLFGTNGLLGGKTVILATNQVYRLPHASFIAILEGGKIVEQGEYETLLTKEGMVAKLVRDFAAGAKKEAKKPAEPKDGLVIAESFEGKELKANERETETGKKGSVSWSTYMLYLRGIGLAYSAACKRKTILTMLTSRARACGDDRCRRPDHLYLPPSLDDDPCWRLEGKVRRFPRRIRMLADWQNRHDVHMVLSGFPPCSSDGQQKSASVADSRTSQVSSKMAV